MKNNKDSQFEIYIDFQPAKGNPSRVFKTMASLIDSFNNLDTDLALMVGRKIKPQLVLEEVEGGSIKAKLRSIIEDIPDDAIQESSVKKILGHFLLKAKYKVLEWTNETSEINSVQDIKGLEENLLTLAENTNIKELVPSYAPIETKKLLNHINTISNSLSPLTETDKISYITSEGSIEVKSNIMISENIITELLTNKTIEHVGISTLKIKKPDYLGQSKWLLYYEGHPIEAKISDVKWLQNFQERKEVLQPGDSIRATLTKTVSYDHHGDVMNVLYEVIEVFEIIPKKSNRNLF